MKNGPNSWATGLVLALALGCGSRPPLETESDKTKNLPVEKRLPLGDGATLDLTLIPAGSFVMGDEAGLDDERPVHEVTISRSFYLGRYEVTVGQFRRFVEATGYTTDAERGSGFKGAFGWDRDAMQFRMDEKYSWRSTGFIQSDLHPVVNVSWNDAMEFCRWLGRVDGKPYRLPTEAEWEYACRAGTTTRYSYGDDPEGAPAAANVADAAFTAQFPELKGLIKAGDGDAYTSPVGSFAPNRFGVYDMHGNAWEWCADWFDAEYYAKSPPNDPGGPTAGEERVYRGGGWFNCARGWRSASRSASQPENRNLSLGFRVAATAE
jgi:formylglycine-generating enzyme required for sulfatase activity